MTGHIRFVYFDVGDTLLQKVDLLPGMQRILAAAGYPVDLPLLRRIHKTLTETQVFPPAPTKAFYLEFNALLMTALGLLPDEHVIERLYQNSKSTRWSAADGWQLVAGSGVPYGILSNWDHSLRGLVAELLPGKWDPIFVSSEAGLAKPDPEFFRTAVAATGRAPGEILMVGDSVRLDVAPAIAAGMQTLLLDPFNLFPYHPGRRVGSLSEVAEVLRAHDQEAL
jgi:HAD superfamily hydrolase (TIGR01549 family)